MRLREPVMLQRGRRWTSLMLHWGPLGQALEEPCVRQQSCEVSGKRFGRQVGWTANAPWANAFLHPEIINVCVTFNYVEEQVRRLKYSWLQEFKTTICQLMPVANMASWRQGRMSWFIHSKTLTFSSRVKSVSGLHGRLHTNSHFKASQLFLCAFSPGRLFTKALRANPTLETMDEMWKETRRKKVFQEDGKWACNLPVY